MDVLFRVEALASTIHFPVSPLVPLLWAHHTAFTVSPIRTLLFNSIDSTSEKVYCTKKDEFRLNP